MSYFIEQMMRDKQSEIARHALGYGHRAAARSAAGPSRRTSVLAGLAGRVSTRGANRQRSDVEGARAGLAKP